MKVGVDLEQIKRFKLPKTSSLIKKIFSTKEIDYCFAKQKPEQHLAARFAAKEAFFKASGKKTSYKKVEVRNNKQGKPFLFVNGKKTGLLSLSHSSTHAVAFLVLQ
ncbi:holo-ACP synthase [Candidatus Micrarchaeota archaeon]|nr:holo-ACP synthase [Candidatus Micrarchaeota archaeon]